jgi:hypothetical protein
MDLFDGSAPEQDNDFQWSVAVFKADGASKAIQRANGAHLRTYYPFYRNKMGDLKPLFRNYLFLEFQKSITISICRTTSNFIKMLSMMNEEGEYEPVLVRKDAIYENMRLLRLGAFNDINYQRRYYGVGSLVNIISGDFSGRRVELLGDITIDMPGNKKVLVDINGWRASIEIFKLAL